MSADLVDYVIYMIKEYINAVQLLNDVLLRFCANREISAHDWYEN